MRARLIAWTAGLALGAVAGAGDRPVGPPLPKLPPGFDAAAAADPKAAAKAADWLETEYPKDGRPESIRMLVAVLRKGGQLTGEDGWFGPAQTRFTWAWLAGRYGPDAQAKEIRRGGFRGPAAAFDRLDRDGDGKITPGDLDWSDRNPYVQQLNFASRLFRRMDASGDGEWGIALRSAAISGSTVRLFAGCGIVADSDPEAELAEAQAKFVPVRDALTAG